MKDRIPVAILAATGSVGQRFIQLLDEHPFFRVTALTASDRTIGQKYGDACHWILPGGMPEWARGMEILPTIAAIGIRASRFLGIASRGRAGDRACFRQGGYSGVFQCIRLPHGSGCPHPVSGGEPRTGSHSAHPAPAAGLERWDHHEFQLHQHRAHRGIKTACRMPSV